MFLVFLWCGELVSLITIIRLNNRHNRKVLYFTDNDDPHNSDESQYRATRNIAKDLDDEKINIYPFLINPNENKVFDITKCYEVCTNIESSYKFL